MMRCETCKAWDRTDPSMERFVTCRATGAYTTHESRTGRMCHLMPVAVAKEPDDWCMQHTMIGEFYA
jgi:hypothetical protein